MATYITRVELYGSPTGEVYNDLHSAMQSKSFTRKINDNGKIFELPHAEYALSSDLTTVQVLEAAKLATNTVWKDFAVFVTQTQVRWEYYNLKPSKA